MLVMIFRIQISNQGGQDKAMARQQDLDRYCNA